MPDAHAETKFMHGPLAPTSIATTDAPMLDTPSGSGVAFASMPSSHSSLHAPSS